MESVIAGRSAVQHIHQAIAIQRVMTASSCQHFNGFRLKHDLTIYMSGLESGGSQRQCDVRSHGGEVDVICTAADKFNDGISL